MFRNLLVGIDGSPSATEAVAQAIEIARASRGRLGVLGVAPSPSLGARMALPPFAIPITPRRLAAQLRQDAQRHEAVRTVPPDVPVTKLLAIGSMAHALVDNTRDGHWDLVVIGPRTLAHRPVRTIAVPVLIVPSASDRSPGPPGRSSTGGRRDVGCGPVLHARPLA